MSDRPLLIATLVSILALAGCEQPSSVKADAGPATMPDTTPPGKPHFDSTGAKVGEQVPDLLLYTLKGKQSEISFNQPTLLLASSYTCPKSRSTYPRAAVLAWKYSKVINVVIIYVIEAHPSGDPSPYSGVEDVTTENLRDHILCRQPRTLEQRLDLARQFNRKMEVGQKIYVDSMDNAAWKALGGGPNMAVLVDEHRIVQARQGWFDDKALDAAVRSVADAAPARSKLEFEGTGTADFDLALPTRDGDLPAVEKQIAQRPQSVHDIIKYMQRGQGGDRTLLDYAIEEKHFDIVKLLVDRGADVNLETEHVAPPLHLAAKPGDVEIAKYLLAHGAKVNVRAHGYGPTALQEAMIHANRPIVELLKKAGESSNFFTAVWEGKLDVVKAAIEKDASIAARPDGWGRPPLAYAATGGSDEMVKLILSAGGRDFPPPPWGENDRSALSWAVRQNNAAMVRLLCDNGSDPNLLDDAVIGGSAEVVRELLAHKADPNRQDVRGYGPMHWVAIYNHSEIASALLESGADANAPTGVDVGLCGTGSSDLETPLHFAAEQGSAETVSILLKHGGKIEALDTEDRTPLLLAVGSYLPPAKVVGGIEVLLAAGANINARQGDGSTPLDVAQKAFRTGEKPDDSIVKLLKKHGAKEGAEVPGAPPTPPKAPFGFGQSQSPEE